MFTINDLEFVAQKNITLEQLIENIKNFENGFAPLCIKDIATVENGIIQTMSDKERQSYTSEWNAFQKEYHKVVKFVPASGAASRMFKFVFEFLQGKAETPDTTDELIFFGHIDRFAFFEDLNEACLRNNYHTVNELIEQNCHKDIVRNLLEKQGLNYGQLPKGLLKFHSYPDEKRTPFHEHLLEGALYTSNYKGEVNLHFTVSPEHLKLFQFLTETDVPRYEQRYNIKYNISFSEQKSSTDTLAVDENNNPVRDDNGNLLFRPGGHGALIENLNDIDADIIFIKNIDNVVPDRLKSPTVDYKKTLAGLLIQRQRQIFEYLNQLDKGDVDENRIAAIQQFCEQQLNIRCDEFETFTTEAKIDYLRTKLNRPIRVCGMVRNTGEPGGGPFLVTNPDGTYSPQILESSQINTNDPAQKDLMTQSTHFNPVDLVCAVRNYKGEKFDLKRYIDKNTGFISLKSKSGKTLKALELPGLWNGAMSDWNTLFVEVPVETFNPVKTVNDLLREQHQ